MVTSNYMADVKVEVAFNAGYSTAAGSRTWTDVTDYAELAEGIDITHGRGNEFGTCDPNQLRLTLDNRDGRFTAGKTGGAYYPNVKIGRPIRVTSALPGANYVTNSTFEVDAASWESNSAFGFYAAATWARSTTRANSGAASLLATWPTTATATWVDIPVDGLTIGNTYTASAYIWTVAGTPDPKMEVAFTATGTATSTKSAWTRISVTWVATAVQHFVGVRVDNSTAGQQCWIDDVMVNQGSSVAAFTSSQAVSVRFLGYVDEWPVEWDGTDAYAKADITASSRMARLGFDAELRSTVTEEILLDAPYAYYPLNEEGDSAAAGNIATTAQPVLVQSGAGEDVAFGETIGAGPLAMPTAKFDPAGKYLYTTIPYGTTNSTIECFAAFTAVSSSAWLVSLGGGDAGTIGFDSSGHITWEINGSGGTSAAAYDDGTVHHYALTGLTSGSGNFYIDGVLEGAGMSAVSVGAGGLHVGDDFAGNVAHVAVYQSALSVGRILAHAEAGLIGFAGGDASARIIRYGYFGGIPQAEIATDADTSPLGAIDTAGHTALDAMRVVETTENGVLYDARDNTLTFKGRNARYNQAAALTLDIAAGEVQAGLVPKLDRSQLVNDVTATSVDGSTTRAINQTSIDTYGYARQSLDVASTNTFAYTLATWLVSRYGEPESRIPALGVGLLTSGLTVAEQVALLAADVGTKMTVTGFPLQAPASSIDFFIEGYNETIGPESYDFSLNVSPTEGYDAFVLDDATKGKLDDTTYKLAL